MDNELTDSTEAAETDSITVYYTEQPTVGQQIASSFIAVAVPIVAGFGLLGAVTVIQYVGGKVRARKDRKAAEAAAKTIVVEETPESE